MDHDDDILLYALYDKGERIDEYNSAPDYFNDVEDGPADPTGGNAEALVRLFGDSETVVEVDNILRKPSFDDDGYVFAYERHQALVECLGLPNLTVGYGYAYVFGGDLPAEYERSDFLDVD